MKKKIPKYLQEFSAKLEIDIQDKIAKIPDNVQLWTLYILDWMDYGILNDNDRDHLYEKSVRSMVVVAGSQAEARDRASENCGPEGKDIWLDPERTNCWDSKRTIAICSSSDGTLHNNCVIKELAN